MVHYRALPLWVDLQRYAALLPRRAVTFSYRCRALPGAIALLPRHTLHTHTQLQPSMPDTYHHTTYLVSITTLRILRVLCPPHLTLCIMYDTQHAHIIGPLL